MGTTDGMEEGIEFTTVVAVEVTVGCELIGVPLN